MTERCCMVCCEDSARKGHQASRYSVKITCKAQTRRSAWQRRRSVTGPDKLVSVMRTQGCMAATVTVDA